MEILRTLELEIEIKYFWVVTIEKQMPSFVLRKSFCWTILFRDYWPLEIPFLTGKQCMNNYNIVFFQQQKNVHIVMVHLAQPVNWRSTRFKNSSLSLHWGLQQNLYSLPSLQVARPEVAVKVPWGPRVLLHLVNVVELPR